MGRAWRIYRTFVASSVARDIEFRANFIAKVLQNLVWMFFFVIVLMVIFSNTATIAGWTKGEALILAASCFIIEGFVNLCFGSLNELPEMVRRGTLDYVITRPIDTQYWISCRKFNFSSIGNVFAGLIILGVGMNVGHVHATVAQFLGYFFGLAISLGIFYSLYLAFMSTAIWFVRVDNLWVLSSVVLDVARFPIDIFGIALRRTLTYIVPLAFIASVPATQLVRGFNVPILAVGLAFSAVALLASRSFWLFAARRYNSASS